MNEKEIKIISEMITAMIARTPDYINENIKIEEFPFYLDSFNKEPSKIFTLDDYVVQLKAMMNHDISRNYNGSLTEAAKIIKAKLFIIISEKDMIVNPTEALRLADIMSCKKMILTNNCGHLAVSCELEELKLKLIFSFQKTNNGLLFHC